MVPRVLASSPTGLSCHTGFSVKTQSRMSQRISEQLYEISCSSWHRGSRLPCAEVLVSPDFLSMFLAACGGVSALLPYAATCKAWRDAVDVQPSERVRAMIDAITRHAVAGRFVKSSEAMLAAAKMPVALLTPHVPQLIEMTLRRGVHSVKVHNKTQTLASMLINRLQAANGALLAAQVPAILSALLEGAPSLPAEDGDGVVHELPSETAVNAHVTLQMVGREALVHHLPALVELASHPNLAVKRAGLDAFHTLLCRTRDPLEPHVLAAGAQVVWPLIESGVVSLTIKAISMARTAFPVDHLLPYTAHIAALPVGVYLQLDHYPNDQARYEIWRELSYECLAFIGALPIEVAAVAMVAFIDTMLSNILLNLPDVPINLWELMHEAVKLVVSTNTELEHVEFLKRLLSEAAGERSVLFVDNGLEGALLAALEALMPLDIFKTDHDYVEILFDALARSKQPVGDGLYSESFGVSLEMSLQLEEPGMLGDNALTRTLDAKLLEALSRVPAEMLQASLMRMVDVVSETSLQNIGGPEDDRYLLPSPRWRTQIFSISWRPGTAQLMAVLGLHPGSAVRVQGEHVDRLLTSINPLEDDGDDSDDDDDDDAPIDMLVSYGFLGDDGLLVNEQLRTPARLTTAMARLGTALVLLEGSLDLCTDERLGAVCESVALCCHLTGDSAQNQLSSTSSGTQEGGFWNDERAGIVVHVVRAALRLLGHLDAHVVLPLLGGELWSAVSHALQFLLFPTAESITLELSNRLGGYRVDLRPFRHEFYKELGSLFWKLEASELLCQPECVTPKLDRVVLSKMLQDATDIIDVARNDTSNRVTPRMVSTLADPIFALQVQLEKAASNRVARKRSIFASVSVDADSETTLSPVSPVSSDRQDNSEGDEDADADCTVSLEALADTSDHDARRARCWHNMMRWRRWEE